MKNGNQPFFSSRLLLGEDKPTVIVEGATKREVFAMAAMQGILANRDLQVALTINGGVASAAVEMADELIAELAKTETP